MALIRRVSRLFAADMHAVLDQLEEPEIVVRQAIREMEEELARQEQRETWLGREIDSAGARLTNLEAALAELDTKLDLCFASDNETLARKLVRRKLETAQLATQVKDQREGLTERRAELRSRIAGFRDQLEGMRQKAEILKLDEVATRRAPESGLRIDEDDVEIALLREKQARAVS